MKKKPAKKYVKRHEIQDGAESAVLHKTVKLAKLLKTIASGKQPTEVEMIPSSQDPLKKKISRIIKSIKDLSES